MPKEPPCTDLYENGVTPSNIKGKPKNPTAVALTMGDGEDATPRIAAAGRGKIAEQILQLAFANGVRVREDSALAEMLAKIELESPIPSEAFLAVAEVMSYVYKANNQPNPFDALLDAATGIKPDQDMKENDRGHN
ncbi:MAG TPA: EscU/YscU/HrcU family type III secretion system export apparatus switch protein [Alphaproteobacteria bacterium]|jgi:flagellar biosynthesis protein|nr:EscU/YscU/HrcU family type III secretion system export apparatus switch protein [Alphaproteobacteria bacterium]MCB9984405.1 EscU/YscU/HrcU family type III secretion system export apparatus switch protein [Micavibrio sp.]HPQ50933.1 EscU/YscU/HrcU family type III secretion system export apparatus switch protein [Alphaproteobacteria bacterium]HRK97829.1 EscU/YscU/HrcU family type III secretion system export apparatus switch protein [Alphaproteobacteria bacterium]